MTCGQCKFFRDFHRADGYDRTSHCLIHTQNYYAQDESDKPRKAYVPVLAEQKACGQFECKTKYVAGIEKAQPQEAPF